jgi:WhiB family redox-sensing transcriptional regulator
MSHTTRRASTVAAPLDTDWRTYAACATTDPETFFPVGNQHQIDAQTADAKRVCGGCPVRERCLNWALDTGQTTGVWGGMSENERRLLARGVPAQDLTVATTRNRTWKESRYWPHYPNAVAGILATRMPEVRALVKRGALVGEMALKLQTNAQTVRKVLERLESAEEVQAA